MKRGPEKTSLGAFKGFGFGLSGGSAGSSAAPGLRPATAAARRPAFGGLAFGAAGDPGRKAAPGRGGGSGVAALFQESLEDEGSSAASSSKPAWSKLSHEAMQAQRDAETLLQEDPTIFQYDEVLDDIKADADLECAPQSVRVEGLQQKKRVGLVVKEQSDQVKSGAKRQAKYIEKVLVATDRRKVEQQIVEDRLLKKEKDARKDCEVFVTEAFKDELKKRKKFEDELEAQEFKDQMKAAEKQENGTGFASMYRNLLNGGLATSRGGERLREQTAPKEELPDDEDSKMETKKEEVKEEEEDGAGPSHGVQDVVAGAEAEAPSAASIKEAKEAREKEEREQRESKAMSAKERYLARKREAAAAAGAQPQEG
mmetsp:Transcript_19745/g.44439  ORF Transcript_19745/g.44439 Transcript_19745/m.44439 type:complete len:370 (-) Transcript_19745:95-1204(-)